MTPDNRKRRKNTWGSVIGWIIFILLIAGRPIFSTLQRVLGNNVALPANLPNLIPLAIGGLVVLSIVVAVLRAVGNATSSRGDTRLPTDMSRSVRPPDAAMSPFGGAARPTNMPSSPRAFTLPPSSARPQQIPPPRFEPLINPVILVVGIVGLLALGGAALLFFGLGGP
jgi:hypothetical protein